MQPALDLSSVRHMINAAEPVDGPSLDAFIAAFRPHGLRCPSSAGEEQQGSGVIYPTYGLAEHTVFVCGGGTYPCASGKPIDSMTTLGNASLTSIHFKPTGRQRLWVDKAALEGPQQRVALLSPGAAGAREIIGCGVPRHGAHVS